MLAVFIERNLILFIILLFMIIFLNISFFLKKSKLLYILIILDIIISFIICYFLIKSYEDIIVKEGIINTNAYIYDIKLIDSDLNLYNITIDDLNDDRDEKITLSIFTEAEKYLKKGKNYPIEYNKYTKKLLKYTY